jgi:hypothetical protein
LSLALSGVYHAWNKIPCNGACWQIAHLAFLHGAGNDKWEMGDARKLPKWIRSTEAELAGATLDE